ncbi:MAG: hypothetical protein HKN48_03530, partial [Flavobacteriaceae bacterium]|nr:hypothetical protein [Flavobacteriaceae bacterium]
SCGEDEEPLHTDPEPTLEVQRQETPQSISNGDSKTWRISNAVLTNDSGTFDISENFNVKDDEFIFKADQTLEWRAGNDININGSNASETLLDYYRSPVTTTFEYSEDSSTEATALNGTFSFTVEGQNSIEGVLTFAGRSAAGEIAITLTEKTASDYVTAPLSSGLDFTEVNTFNSAMVVSGSVGMTGSYADNSMMVVTREPEGNASGPEKIFKLLLDTNTFEFNEYLNADFVTKRPHIINGELIVVGGRFVNIYPLDLSGDPVTYEHLANPIGLTRFGSAVVNDDIFIVGGDLDEDINGDKVRKFNPETGQLDEFATLPQPRFWAESEIVNNKLYIFGGQQVFVGSETVVETTSYIVDLDTGNVDSFELPVELFASFTARIENLIYVSGQIRDDTDGDGIPDDYNIYFGVYDTNDDSFTEISTNLDDSDLATTVYGMTLFNDKLYVVYGDAAQPTDPIPTWQIMAADLN